MTKVNKIKTYDLDLDAVKGNGNQTSFKEFAESVSNPLQGLTQDILDMIPTVDRVPEFNIDLSHLEQKEEEEAEIRRMQLKLLRKQLEIGAPKLPTFNRRTSVLTFFGSNIQIPRNTLEQDLCNVILKSKSAMLKQWSSDEIADKWNEEHTDKLRLKIYRAAKRVRDNIAKKTGVPDFLIVNTYTVQVHPSYLQSIKK